MPRSIEYATDFRARPECYQIGRGEAGVFKVQPYKSELLPLWSFKTPEAARASAAALWAQYEAYRVAGDFVGMDMARKYLQMGFTRAMRYAKFPGGRKLDPDGTPREPQQWADPAKREAALVFKAKWDAVRADPVYQERKAAHQAHARPSECDEV
ncbi:MAG: DUF4385 domain-containing protein [Rhodothermaceae bacterium]|nr:DUF4385 domain-containing protein [Rhodothermaceae bacterium]